MFEDVPEALKKWHDLGIKVFLFFIFYSFIIISSFRLLKPPRSGILQEIAYFDDILLLSYK